LQFKSDKKGRTGRPVGDRKKGHKKSWTVCRGGKKSIIWPGSKTLRRLVPRRAGGREGRKGEVRGNRERVKFGGTEVSHWAEGNCVASSEEGADKGVAWRRAAIVSGGKRKNRKKKMLKGPMAHRAR